MAKKSKSRLKIGCRKGHGFFVTRARARKYVFAKCPKCGEMVKIENEFQTRAFSDSSTWNPWLPNCGEYNRADRIRRMKDGSLRRDPKTGQLSGYFPTRKGYINWLHEKGAMNSWGEGRIDKSRQGWDNYGRG